MPASRWQTSYNDLFQWMGETDDELLSMIMPSMLPRIQKKDSDASESESSKAARIIQSGGIS
jgi:hypothetical protein